MGDLDAYVDLTIIQETYSDWNIKKILNNIYYFDIYNVRWEGEKIYVDLNGSSGINPQTSYIQITNNQGKQTFSTNLPNNMDKTKSYYFYETYRANSIIIGYKNQTDGSDKFDAYSISNLKYNSYLAIFTISVYNFSNAEIYTMKYQYL